jgi:DNA-binding HxlR family transcriptional regulator
MPQQTRPIVALLALLSHRWSMRILWELREPAPSVRALQARCDDISSSVLWQRLNELRGAGLVANGDGGGVSLTDAGHELLTTFVPLHEFAERWAARRG